MIFGVGHVIIGVAAPYAWVPVLLFLVMVCVIWGLDRGGFGNDEELHRWRLIVNIVLWVLGIYLLLNWGWFVFWLLMMVLFWRGT